MFFKLLKIWPFKIILSNFSWNFGLKKHGMIDPVLMFGVLHPSIDIGPLSWAKVDTMLAQCYTLPHVCGWSSFFSEMTWWLARVATWVRLGWLQPLLPSTQPLFLSILTQPNPICNPIKPTNNSNLTQSNPCMHSSRQSICTRKSDWRIPCILAIYALKNLIVDYTCILF